MKKKYIILTFLFLFLLNFKAYAKDDNNLLDMSKLETFSQRLQAEENYLPDISFSKMISTYKETGSTGITLKTFLQSLLKYIFNEVTANSRLFVELLIIGILCAILQNIQNAFQSDGISKIAYYVCFLIMVIIIIKSFTVSIDIGKKAINSMIEFTNALMPALIVLLAAVGGFSSAATLDPILMSSIKITSDIIRDLIIPMTMITSILYIVNNLSDEIKISKLADLIKQINLWILAFIMTIFTAVVTIRSHASSTFDEVAVKSAKFAVDNFIPVVGKCLSDAVTTVAGYSLILKDAVSIAGLIIMVIICIFPLIKIIIVALIYKFVSAVMEPIVDKKIINCLSAVGNSITMIFVCVLSVAVMFFIMITIIAQTGRFIVMAG
ncbi:stage III sporulation protein AE [Caloramator quimbayensis]|uniref:Stage III sporulation protein AE n=1 Tax=Caloramator quimbayensis TaxID=1147123 RepID=A0A1T4WX58_9CLOT|nr:stage III sporulation protein AE [Caloramator quimbayensis]SKA81952.1 stage III sporulation protein AE [Caloramator quimbayensis]